MKNLVEFGVICCDSNDAIRSWDAKAHELFGWNFQQIKGKDIFPLLFPRKRDAEATSRLAALFASQHQDEALTLRIEQEAVHRDGTSLPVELLISRSPGKEYFTLFVQKTGAGKKEPQREAELINKQEMDLQLINLVNSLQEEKQFSEAIIQGLQHGLIVTDQCGTIRKCNGAAKSIFNWFSNGLEGVSLDSVVGSRNSQQILNSSSSGALPQEAELLLAAADGSQMIIRYSAITRSISGKKEPGHIISLTNISEWRRVRKEMEKMNRLSTIAELASAVAHEVRNPLAGIKIMAQSIEENSGTRDEREECSRRIIRQVDRLNELLTDFFSYARPVTPKKRHTSLTEILSETKPLIAGRLEKQRIQIVENFDAPLPPVIADPNQLQQVFLNLFLNAIDAIRQEGIIEISACRLTGSEVPLYCQAYHQLQKEIPYVMLNFTDNGAGMSKSGTERVFEPFYTTKTNGSGLGMSIVHRTLQENDAAITVSSTEGKGTTFTMFFKSGG